MTVTDILELVKKEALLNESFRLELLNTQNENQRISKFCKICSEHVFMLNTMDLVEAGEESYAALRRSTNGGGENSPLLAGEDDLYEMFLVEIMDI